MQTPQMHTLMDFKIVLTRDAAVLAIRTLSRSVMLSVSSAMVEAAPRTSSLSMRMRLGIVG